MRDESDAEVRSHFVGYLLGALEAEEQEAVERYVQSRAQARGELETLRRALVPLEMDVGHMPAPAGLAARTCRLVSLRAQAVEAVPIGRGLWGWQFRDMAMAAGVFLVAGLLVLPAAQRSWSQSRRLACKGNLHAIGTGLLEYSDRYAGQFPYVPEQGRYALAGIYRPILVENGFVTDPSKFVCPAAKPEGPLPSLVQLAHASEGSPELAELRRRMGGPYGYTFGHLVDGRYQGTRNLGRANFAILADQPPRLFSSTCPSNSPNHGGCGQNVWYDDGHAAWVTRCAAGAGSDDIFRNRRGEVRAGIGPDDAVLAPSEAAPLEF